MLVIGLSIAQSLFLVGQIVLAQRNRLSAFRRYAANQKYRLSGPSGSGAVIYC